MTGDKEAMEVVAVTRNGKKSSDSGEEKATLSADVSLPADVLEKLYQSYAIKQKRDGLSSFLVASIMFDLWAIIVPQGQRLESLGEFLEPFFHLLLQLLFFGGGFNGGNSAELRFRNN